MWYGIYKEAAKNPLTEDQMLQIAIDYENGMHQQDIFRKYHIHKEKFEKALSFFGIDKRDRAELLRAFSLSERKQIADEIKNGSSMKEVLLRYKTNPNTIYKILEEFGVKLPGRRSDPRRQSGIENRIIELYRILKSITNVAKELGIGSSLVYDVLKEHNEEITHKTRQERPFATEEQYLEISHRYELGEGYRKLAEEYGVNTFDLRRRLIQEGVFDESRNTRPRKLSKEQINQAAEMATRMPFIDVARFFDIHPASLTLLLNENGHFTSQNELIKRINRERMVDGYRQIPISEHENIFRLYDIEGKSMSDIARLYNATKDGIGAIIRNRNREQESRQQHQAPVQASFNLRRLLQASYSNEIGYLNRYLKEGFDPNDYEFELKTYLENQGQEFDEDLEYYDIAQEWLGKASKEDLEKFKKWVQNRPPSDMTDSPAYEAMSYNSFVKPTWLVHFTDDPYSIAREGFKYGHEDTHGLALTTWYTNEARKRHAGYNFAFKVGSRDARICARQNKYGKHAVVFWGAGVEAYHSGDEEDQIIIWGPSVNTNLIFPVLNEEGSWVVNDWRNDKLLIKDDDFNKVAEWVVNNNQMLQQIRNKKT